mgnify:FL=1
MNYFKISLGIFIVLAASRFIPHPPNFTSLIALSFYVPAFLGTIYIFPVILSFAITDLFIGLHGVTLFTWGSVILIGIISQFFKFSIFKRISGSIIGVIIFFIFTNFGVWTQGFYGYTLEGLTTCYLLALPFVGYSLVSTLIFSSIIESIISIKVIKKKILK